jgi:hypothetical protein
MREPLEIRERRRTYLLIASPVTHMCISPPRERARETGRAIDQWARYFPAAFYLDTPVGAAAVLSTVCFDCPNSRRSTI